MIDIEIKLDKPNHFRSIIHKIHRQAENILFAIIQKLPERMIPQSFIDWMGKYLQKQISAKNHQLIRSRWEEIELNKVINKINQQQAQK